MRYATLIILLILIAGCDAQIKIDSEYEKRLAEYEKDRETAEKAVQNLDPYSCIEISDLDIRDTCYYDVAAAGGNFSVCELMYRQSSKDICHLTIGKATKDITLCNKIKTLSMQEECIAATK